MIVYNNVYTYDKNSLPVTSNYISFIQRGQVATVSDPEVGYIRPHPRVLLVTSLNGVAYLKITVLVGIMFITIVSFVSFTLMYSSKCICIYEKPECKYILII
jgi:hypothetical protein